MDNFTSVLEKKQIDQDPGQVTPEEAIKRYCANCLSADGFDECTGTGCPLFPVSPYKSEGLPVINSATVTKKALVNKGPHTALQKQSISPNNILRNGGRIK